MESRKALIAAAADEFDCEKSSSESRSNDNKWNKSKLNFDACLGRGGSGLVVSMLAFYFDGPSSNPAEVYSLTK